MSDQLSKTGSNRDEGISKGMPEDSSIKANPLSNRSANVVSSKIIHQVVLHHHGHPSKSAHHVAHSMASTVVPCHDP